jgi:hypothetical protein
MCGKSRAGKTTTARTLARHGGTLVAEDLIILAPDLTTPRVFVSAEAKVLAWAREATGELARGPGTTVDTDGLRAAADGPTFPVDTLWFLDARRRGDGFARTALPRATALAELLAHDFLGAAGHESWRRHLASGHSIISAVAAFEVALPDGLDRLDEAMKRYATTSAS